MSKAIKITMKKADAEYDLSASKFFGDPTIPKEWYSDFYDDVIFFCQIRLSDIAALDTENNLPHTGYLYVFIDTEDGHYKLRGEVRYHDGEPDMVIDDFNSEVPGYERFTQAWLMEFEEVEEDYYGTKLFGTLSDWNYVDDPPKLLMQYDPLDNDTDFLDFLDGYVYFLFGDDPKDFSAVTLREEYT